MRESLREGQHRYLETGSIQLSEVRIHVLKPVLQLRRDKRDNLGTISHNAPLNCMSRSIIRIVSPRRF